MGLHINSRCSFERFVVGPGNQFAYAAALAVSEETGGDRTPLLIYGGAGAGKTHLLVAIQHRVARDPSGPNLVLVSTFGFMKEMIDGLLQGTISAFQSKYRDGCGGLLFDDLQFVAGKERTQAELLGAFDFLLGRGRRIVVASDRPPEEIEDLDEGLRSRLESCFTVSIQPPDSEIRLAILRAKAEERGVALTDDVSLFLTNSASNIRTMERSLNQILAHARFSGSDINLEFAKKHFNVSSGDSIEPLPAV